VLSERDTSVRVQPQIGPATPLSSLRPHVPIRSSVIFLRLHLCGHSFLIRTDLLFSPPALLFLHSPASPISPCPTPAWLVYSMDYEDYNWSFTIGIERVPPSQPRKPSLVTAPSPVTALTGNGDAPSRLIHAVLCSPSWSRSFVALHTHKQLSTRRSHIYLYYVHNYCQLGTQSSKPRRWNRARFFLRPESFWT
jgi:hypothetical protein